MEVVFGDSVTVVNEWHPEKVSSPMLVMAGGRVIEAKCSQPAKASCPMLVTVSGIIILSRES